MRTQFFKNKILFILLTLATGIFAQKEEIVPLSFDAQLFKEYNQKLTSNLKTAATTDTITLPFLDDFSLTFTSSPDTALWLEDNGGTYINNRLPVFPPSKNVATFDALQANGTPYYFSSSSIVTGLADQLTSKPIDLSGLVPSDSLALSFYWQKGGRSVNSFPDQNDSLIVQFLDTSSTWVTELSILGNNIIDDSSLEEFYYQFLKIDNEKYFHEGFQIRFQLYCNLSGNFDTYHLDYIYLDTARKANEITADVAYSTYLTSYLKPYTSVTRKQFFSDPTQFVTDSVISYVVNPTGSNFINANINTEPGYLQDTISKTTLEVMNTGINDLLFPGDRKKAFWLPNPANLTANIPPLSSSSPVVLKYKFDMVTEDSLQANDSIIGYNIIDNYMAYDDGSAEAAYQYPQAGNQYALKFELLEQDTLYYIQVFFPKLKTSVANKSITWKIWTGLKGVDAASDKLIYSKTALLKYSTELNGFSIDSMTYRFEFPRSTDAGVIIPAGTFYIGFQQNSDAKILIGMDYNTNSGSNFYVNDYDSWNNDFGSDRKVSMMIRPVFGKRLPFDLTPVSKVENGTLNFSVYPNPAEQEVQIDKKLDVLNVYDITGNLLLTFDNLRQSQTINISTLQPGLYLLEGSIGKLRSVRRLVKY